jgi:hypothetical protein
MLLLGALLAAAVYDPDEKNERYRLHVLRDIRLGFVPVPGARGHREPLAIGWNALQEDQRGVPESLFHERDNPGISLCGSVQFALEHGGDLVHRAAFGDWGGGYGYGLGALHEKTRKLTSWVKSARSHPRDDPESCARREFRYLQTESDPKWIPPAFVGVDEDEAIRRWRAALARYAEAYRRLRPHSRLQRLGRSIAVSIGQLDLPTAESSLVRMKILLEDAESAGEEAEFNLYYRDVVPPSRFR